VRGMTRHLVVATAILLTLAGCSTTTERTPQACIDALDAADRGFTALAENVRIVQAALDKAFDGDPVAAQRTLGAVTNTDPGPYKHLEAECREAR
jgi:ABC-type uncharacterized transport system auxiliary subunit